MNITKLLDLAVKFFEQGDYDNEATRKAMESVK